MRLCSCTLQRYSLPFVKPHSLAKREGIVVTVGDADGKCYGSGEIAPLPGFSRESLQEASQQAGAITKQLMDVQIPERWEDLEEWLREEKALPSVLFGLETAFSQLLAASRGISLRHLLGADDEVKEITINSLLGPGETLIPDGVTCVKLKVACLPVEEEIAAVHKLVETGVTVRLDANRGWDLETAICFGCACRDLPLDYIEEPVSRPADLVRWHEACGLFYALDETIQEGSDLDFSKWPGLKAIVLKPTLLGGIGRVLWIARQAHDCGVQAVLSAAFEGPVGLAALANLAAAMPDPSTPVGLDTFSWFGDDVLPVRRGRLRWESM